LNFHDQAFDMFAKMMDNNIIMVRKFEKTNMWSQQGDHWLHQLINKYWWNVFHGNQHQIYLYVKRNHLEFFLSHWFHFFFTFVPRTILVKVIYPCVHSCNKFSSFLFREKKMGWFFNFKFILICVHLFLNILLSHIAIFCVECYNHFISSLHFLPIHANVMKIT